MRVAICLSGLVRTYRQTYDNFKQCLIDSNPDCEFDIFINTWSIEQSNNSTERTRRVAWYGEDHPLFPEDIIDYNDIRSKYAPKVIKITEPILFDIPDGLQKINAVNLQSILSMTHSIYRCHRLLADYQDDFNKQYDIIIRHRFDTLLPFPILLSSCDLSGLTVPSMMQPHIIADSEWTNDKFAIGTFDLIDIYSNWYFVMAKKIADLEPQIQPETVLCEHLKSYNIKTIELGNEFDIIRPAGY